MRTRNWGRKAALFGVATASALGLAVSTAPQAAAAGNDACTTYGCYTGDGWGSGFGRWQANGDKMWVCDRAADGWSVVVVSGGKANKWHTGGAGGCTVRSYGDLIDGWDIGYRACLGDASEGSIIANSCGRIVHATI
ncbi:hypothetical protein [Streptomyces sp. PU-14G]|uniref:hypothetical protein n=1 Tax=Streptomyces sp. PU-14G TaxID=2800808 RepID=UPI0034E00961